MRSWKRRARQNINQLKEAMRKFPGSTWSVAKYVGKWREAQICDAVENPTRIEADELDDYEVTAGGQVRKTKKQEEGEE